METTKTMQKLRRAVDLLPPLRERSTNKHTFAFYNISKKTK